MRKNYLDNIRWMTIVLVVIFHVFYYYNNIGGQAMFAGVPEYTGAVTFAGIYQYFVYPWFMVLLFVVAGISARCALQNRTGKEFMRSRIDKLLVPSTLGVLAFGWIGGYVIYIHTVKPLMEAGTPAFIGVFVSMFSGIGALWFCQLLFVAVLVLMVVRFLIVKCKGSDDKICEWFDRKSDSWVFFGVMLVLLFLILWGGSHILNMPVVTAYRNGIYIPAFLMGYYFFSNAGVIEKLKKLVIPLGIMAAASGVFYIYNCYGSLYSDIPVLSRADLNLYAFLMILFVLGAGAKYLNMETPFMNYMKRCCFGIYVFHIPVLLVTNYLLLNAELPMPAIYLIELIAAFAVSIGLFEAVRVIPVLRYWILGIRKQKIHIDVKE